MAETLFTRSGSPKKWVRDALLKSDHYTQFDSFSAYLAAQDKQVSDSDLTQLRQHIDDQVLTQLRYFSYLMYHHFETTGEWGDAGEQQVKMAFCRLVLNLKSDVVISYSHVTEFDQKISDTLDALGISEKSWETLQKEYDDFAFDILGRRFTVHEVGHLHGLMRFVGCSLYLQGGYYGHARELILGEGTAQKMGDYSVYFFKKERMRTPNSIVAMAAVIGENEIFVREVSLNTIYHQKWVPVYESELAYVEYQPYCMVSELIKRFTLDRYGAHDTAQVLRIKPGFISDMGETILFHELGHGIIQHSVLETDVGALGEATKVCGETIMTAMLEFLADFAPAYDGIKGPIQNMVDIAKNDPDRATRMFMMYVSDTWFFDTSDEYMYLYSDLMALVFISYIGPDLTIDFEAMGRDIGTKDSPGRLLAFFCDHVAQGTRFLSRFLESAQIELDGKPVEFPVAKRQLLAKYEADFDQFDPSDYATRCALWSDVLDGAFKSPDQKQQLESFFRHHQSTVLEGLFNLMADATDVQSFNGDSREYVVGRFLERLKPAMVGGGLHQNPEV